MLTFVVQSVPPLMCTAYTNNIVVNIDALVSKSECQCCKRSNLVTIFRDFSNHSRDFFKFNFIYFADTRKLNLGQDLVHTRIFQILKDPLSVIRPKYEDRKSTCFESFSFTFSTRERKKNN